MLGFQIFKIWNAPSRPESFVVHRLVLLCSRKMSPWGRVTKLRGNRIFKVLLLIKKSFKFIDFDLAKHVLVSSTHPLLHRWVNFDWSGNYEIIIYLCIYGIAVCIQINVFVFVSLHKETAPCNSFKYLQFLKITNIKSFLFLFFIFLFYFCF